MESDLPTPNPTAVAVKPTYNLTTAPAIPAPRVYSRIPSLPRYAAIIILPNLNFE